MSCRPVQPWLVDRSVTFSLNEFRVKLFSCTIVPLFFELGLFSSDSERGAHHVSFRFLFRCTEYRVIYFKKKSL